MNEYNSYNNVKSGMENEPVRYPNINRNKIILHYILIAINIFMYAVMLIICKIQNWPQEITLIVMGAKYNPLIDAGQVWRLFTCMFLHMGVMHLLCNCYAIFLYGQYVERLYGRIRFLIIYTVSGLGGSVLSYLLSPNAAVGASGAIFGLIGCMFHFRDKHPSTFKKLFGPSLLIVLVLNLVLGFTQSSVDNFGHIGGFLWGYVTAYAVGLFKEKISATKRCALCALIIFMFTSCFAIKMLLR